MLFISGTFFGTADVWLHQHGCNLRDGTICKQEENQEGLSADTVEKIALSNL